MRDEDLANMLFGIHEFALSSYSHIKKYKKIRKLESEVTSKLAQYMLSEKYNLAKTLDKVFDYE